MIAISEVKAVNKHQVNKSKVKSQKSKENK